MRVLVIPDIHNKIELTEKIIAKAPKHDRVVFLGDYFDDFGDRAEDARNVANWLKWSLTVPERTHLAGNHDLSYFDRRYRCSGWDTFKQIQVDDVFRNERVGLGSLWVSEETDGVLYSHAGFVEATWFLAVKESLSDSLERGILPWVAACSSVRGGRARVSGPLWRDWSEGVLLWNWTQVVGHTPGRNVREEHHEKEVPHGLMCSSAYCLDTHLRHFAIVTDGKVEVRGIEELGLGEGGLG